MKLVEDGTTTLFPSGGYEVTGGVPTKQIEANGVTVATVVGTGANAVPRYVHTDHLTGSNVVTSQTGAVDELMDYYPYGGIRIDQKAGTFNEREKYAGLMYDVGTGLNYAGSRYYDSSVGKFISQDPAFQAIGDSETVKSITGLDISSVLSDPQALNSYAYARNNPMKYIDPDGNWYFDLSASGVWSGVSGTVGIRIDKNGIDRYTSYGGGIGGGGGINLSLSPLGELSHESEKTTSYSGQAASGFGFGVSREGQWEAADPLGLSGGRDATPSLSIVFGAGASASHEITKVTPIKVWNENNSRGTKNEIISPASGGTTLKSGGNSQQTPVFAQPGVYLTAPKSNVQGSTNISPNKKRN